MLFLTFLSPLSDCRQYLRCSRGAFSTVPCTNPVALHDRDGPRASLSTGAAWKNALLHAEQAKAGGHQAHGFRGRLLRVMHNSWPLWTFRLRPLSLMGNPNRDLFIKTISWLFVVPASHKGANCHLNIITSWDETIALSDCTLTHTISINLHDA